MTEQARCAKCGNALTASEVGGPGGTCARCLASAWTEQQVAPEPGPRTRNTLARIDIERPPLKPGTVFEGLEILEVLARGGMGYVYKARQQSLNRLLAFKVLSPELTSSDTFIRRFEHEAKLVASLNHPNVVRAYDRGKHDDIYFLTMELVTGSTLESLLDRRRPGDLAGFLTLLRDVANGLSHVHDAGLLHRDLKPSNILIAKDGTPKITDFGIAIERDNRLKLTEAGAFVGTPHYVSPEHVLGTEMDGRSDLYSLGVILYQGVAGRLPFDGKTSTAVLMKHVQEPPPPLRGAAPNAPPLLQELVRKLLAKDRASRPESAGAVVREIDRILETLKADKPVVKEVRRSEPGSSPSQESRSPKEVPRVPLKALLVWVGAGVGAVVVLGVLLSLFTHPPEPPPRADAASERKAPMTPAAPIPPAVAPKETAPAVAERRQDENPKSPPAPVAPKVSPAASSEALSVERLVEKADALLAEAKAAFEDGKARGPLDVLVAAGFKVEDARLKYVAIQEAGSEERRQYATAQLIVAAQLGKLINDAKKTLGRPETPAPEPAAKPPEPAPGAAPAKAARAPIPEAAKQRQAEAEIKDLFKADYAKRTPADVQALARKLLSLGVGTRDDLVVRYVFLREARDLAGQAGDMDTALSATEGMAGSFEVDGLASKASILAKLAAAVRSPEASGKFAAVCCAVADEAIAADDYETAVLISAKAETAAKAAKDLSLLMRCQAVSRKAGICKSEFQKIKGTVGNPPAGNPEAAGRFYCFVKGDWSRGLPLLAAGSSEPLKSLATLDLSLPSQPQGQVEVGDGWWALGEKESDSSKKARIQERMNYWYEKALPFLTGLVKSTIEKRLGPPVWRPIFDGRSLDCLVERGWGHWGVVSGALTRISGPHDAAQSTEFFDDGEIRIRFEVKSLRWMFFSVRQGSEGKDSFEADGSVLPAMEGKQHELLFKCRGESVTLTLDGQPALLKERSASRRGKIQFGYVGESLRVYAIEYRRLP